MNETRNQKQLTVLDIFPIYSIVIGSFISTFILITNSCLLFGFWKSLGRNRQTSVVILVPFIFSHWLVGAGGFAQFPTLLIINPTYQQIVHFYDVMGFCLRIVLAINYSLLIMLLVDRLVAVKKPFIYQNFTKEKAFKMLPLALIYPVCYMIALVVDFKNTSMFCSFGYFVTGFCLIAGNLIIFIDVHKQLKQIHQLTVTTTPNENGQSPNNKKPNPSKIFKKKLQKSVMVSMLFTMTFVAFWLPFCVLTITDVIQGGYTGHFLESRNPDLTGILLSLGLCNSITDPMIYVILNRPVRKTLLKTFKCFGGSKNEDFLSNNSTTKSTQNYKI